MNSPFDPNNNNDLMYIKNVLWELKKRSDDKRTQVAAVILDEKGNILSYGVNSLPEPLKNKSIINMEGYDFAVKIANPNTMVNLNKRDIIRHAEHLSLKGLKNKYKDSPPYCCIVTHLPCPNCTAELIDYGIKKIYTFNQRTNSQSIFENKTKAIIALAGIELHILPLLR